MVAGIVADVRARGDAAVVDYTARFDWVGITAANMRISDAERDAAAAQVPAAQREALIFAARRIEAFHRALMPKDVDFTDSTGTRLGARYRPVDAAGV
ncbi:MAG: histidinol dehydrogenase, partial [Hyphomicrobiales bacterium]